jgi:hypothetical protein
LAKFSDPGTKDTTKRKTTKPRGADFDKAKDTLVENGYEFHEDFNLVWISADSIMDEEHMVAILPESAVTETSAIADAEVYRLPDSLVEKGRLLRTRKVRTNKRLINLPKVFDVLTDLKVRNSRELREGLRVYTTDPNWTVFIERAELVFLVPAIPLDETDSSGSYELVRV